jgi:putative tryptophan/tyrosine transport system substrate-binding protein
MEQHGGQCLSRRRDLIATFGAVVVAWPACAWGQTARSRPFIGALVSGRQDVYAPFLSAFLDGMRDHGYVEGQSFDFIVRFADADRARLATAVEELLSLKPDVIVAIDPVAAGAVKKATSAIPIVASILIDPVNQGLIASYARPGGNLTGIANVVQGLNGKIIEIARELVPSAAAIGLVYNPTNPNHTTGRPEFEAAATASGVKVILAAVAAQSDFDQAFGALAGAGVQAVVIIADPMFLGECQRIAALAEAAHLPTISNSPDFVEAGCLISYGVDQLATARRAALFVDKILKGAKPADLPVEFPTKVDLVVNLKTAKTLGIAVPPSIMLRADRVIE